MPLGVPKVPFQLPEEEDATWVDLNRLHRERLLFIGKDVDDEIANNINGLMIYLSIEDKTREIFLFLNCPGGLAIHGVSIYDTMQFVIPHVNTICMGLAASMGAFILLGGEITKRLAFPHARVMIHQPVSSFFGSQTGEIITESGVITRLRERVIKVYVERTGLPYWIINKDLNRDWYMTPTEAKDHGIIDLVGDDTMKFHFEEEE
uniref:ATP-dependent Clp protease proteolytic subunit n=1 Tax=Trillium govanianum TaxID=82485 RepID=A0A5C1D7N2_9LILI|nr:clpP-like protease [Trillium govanianum]QEL51785.1 clpP-like protease [Trillium govanianum]